MQSCYLDTNFIYGWWKAAFTVRQIMNHLVQLHTEIIDNRNIDPRKLCKKCLQLNLTGTSRLLKNLFWSLIKIFGKVKGSPGIINDEKIKPEHPSVFDSALPISVNNSEDQPENRNLKVLTNIRLKSRNNPIIGQLNINSIRNNFDFLCSEIGPNLDLLLDSEMKLMIHFQRHSS